MSKQAADRWVIVSAVTVAGIYAVSKWKGQTKTPVGEFFTAWGVIYFVLALVSTAAPPVGGSFAILVMVADLLGNTPALSKIIQGAGIGPAKTGKPAGPQGPHGLDTPPTPPQSPPTAGTAPAGLSVGPWLANPGGIG